MSGPPTRISRDVGHIALCSGELRYAVGVGRIAIGHRRTGLCPTFAEPTLQRDGFLLRVPLVGGLLFVNQVERLAFVAGRYGNGTVELTNRGNLQLRALARHSLTSALNACREVGLGDHAASLVTISPFAGAAEHALREALVRALANVDAERLSRKFAVHVDDATGRTADRPADVGVRLTNDGSCYVTVRSLGTTGFNSVEGATTLARRLAERCIQHGPHTRPAELVATEGPTALAAALGVTHAWLPAPAARAQPLQVGITAWRGERAQPRRGTGSVTSDEYLAVAAARFGRVNGATLAGIGLLLRRHQFASLRVTPWRTFAFSCTNPAQAAVVLADAASLGLLSDVHDPALGVIACIGSAGCWQTELDTLAQAERFVANRPADIQPGALVHVSGCDKFCATRAPVSLTLLGRPDSSGFDARGWPQE